MAPVEAAIGTNARVADSTVELVANLPTVVEVARDLEVAKVVNHIRQAANPRKERTVSSEKQRALECGKTKT